MLACLLKLSWEGTFAVLGKPHADFYRGCPLRLWRVFSRKQNGLVEGVAARVYMCYLWQLTDIRRCVFAFLFFLPSIRVVAWDKAAGSAETWLRRIVSWCDDALLYSAASLYFYCFQNSWCSTIWCAPCVLFSCRLYIQRLVFICYIVYA